MEIKQKGNIWITYHWWGWKLHFNQEGLDILNNNLQRIPYFRSYVRGFSIIIYFIYLLIFWIAIKIINLKYKACSNDKKRWCNNMLDYHDQCPEIIIKELTITFWWLPWPFLPITNKVIK